METVKKTILFNTDKAWKNLHARLNNEGLIDQDESSGRKRPAHSFMKIAAGFLLLIAAGSILYLTMLRPQQDDLLTFSNPEEQTFVKTLEDGSVVYLAFQSEISFAAGFSPHERRVILKGEAFFDVAHDPDQPFIVEAGRAIIQVVGTSFNVKSVENKQVELFVEEGMVNVRASESKEEVLLVQPGELILISDEELSRVKPGELSLTLWRQNRMHFKDESLANILQVINRNYGSKLVSENEQVSQRRMTVTFYNNSLQGILELICLSMNLEALSQKDDSILLTAK
jgi:transmembrane sensor